QNGHQVIAHIELHARVAEGFKATLVTRQFFVVRPDGAQHPPCHQKGSADEGANDEEKKYEEIFLHAHATHAVSKIKPLDCSILNDGIPADWAQKLRKLAFSGRAQRA